jgi:hypothetical protein
MPDNPITLRLQFLREQSRTMPPTQATPGSAGLDLRAALDVPNLTIAPGARAAIPTGIAIEIGQPGVAGFVFSRPDSGPRRPDRGPGRGRHRPDTGAKSWSGCSIRQRTPNVANGDASHSRTAARVFPVKKWPRNSGYQPRQRRLRPYRPRIAGAVAEREGGTPRRPGWPGPSWTTPPRAFFFCFSNVTATGIPAVVLPVQP